jgi:hypothetical protein
MGTAVAVDEQAQGSTRSARPGSEALRAWLPAGVAAVVAGALALPRLGVRTLWLDETYTVGATNELLATYRHTAGTQALYYLLVWPVSRLSTDPAWIRLPSAVLGMAAVVVVFRIGRRIGGRDQALLGAGGLALSWGLARYSMEARSYTLALLLVSISWLALIAAVQADGDGDGDDGDGDGGNHRRWWWTFYVVTALIPFAHGLATLNYVAQVGALALAPDRRRELVRRALWVAPVLAVELAGLFLMGASDIGDWVPPLSFWELRLFGQLLLGFGVTGVVLGGLTAVAAVDVVRRFRRERSQDAWIRLLPVIWAFGPILLILALSLFRPYAAARYVFPSLPAVFLLVAGLLVRLGSARRIALVAVVLASLLLVDQRRATTEGIEDWSGLTACLAANAAPGDRLVTAGAHRSALDYYWPDHPEPAALEPLSPPEPVGQVRRLYHPRVKGYDGLVSVLLEDTSGSIWYVDRLPEGRHAIVRMAFDEQLAAHYHLVDPWFFEGDLTLTRLDPIGRDRPRGEAPCDTVATPADMRPPGER